MANSVPEAPASAADTVKAMSLYFVMFTPMLSAAMRLSRTAMIARPCRLLTRWNTTMSVIMTRMMPMVKVEYRGMEVRPIGPPMISLPPSARSVLSLSRLMCRPLLSMPTYRLLKMPLMISPKARVTMAR